MDLPPKKRAGVLPSLADVAGRRGSRLEFARGHGLDASALRPGPPLEQALLDDQFEEAIFG